MKWQELDSGRSWGGESHGDDECEEARKAKQIDAIEEPHVGVLIVDNQF